MLAFLCVQLTTIPARASKLVVPDDSPTIQQAIDLRPDTVLVRPGTYAENPILTWEVALLGLAEGDSDPTLDGLLIFPTQFTTGFLTFLVRGITFNRRAIIDNSNVWSMIAFEKCRFLDGVADYSEFPATSREALLGCKVSGTAFLKSDGDCTIDSCEFDSELVVGEENCNLSINASSFHGGGARLGISTIGAGSAIASATITNALVEDYKTGIIMRAIHFVRLDSIVVRNCVNGRGLNADGDIVSIRRSRIERCGDYGIRAAAIESLLVVGNVVTQCLGTGMLTIANQYGEVVNNLSSSNGAHGFHVAANDVSLRCTVAENTSCLNGASGFLSECSINFSGRFDFVGNIGYGNADYGILWGLPNVTAVRCNDWFGNGVGGVQGLPPSSEDFFVDPLFCSVAKGDFGLRPTSPLVNLPRCGQVGALGAGCRSPELNRFVGERVQDGIRVIWELVESPVSAVVWLERSEGANGPWVRPETERHDDGLTVEERDQSVLPDRIYWYRVVSSDAGSIELVGLPIVLDVIPGSAFRLVSVGPSPSRGPLRIEFELSSRAAVSIQVFDIQGRLVASPANGIWEAGRHLAQWDASPSLAGGVFLVRYRFPSGHDMRRVAYRP